MQRPRLRIHGARLLLAGVFCGIGPVATADPGDRPAPSKIDGLVTGASGQPVSGALVRLLPSGLSEATRNLDVDSWVEPVLCRTESDGSFVASPPEGSEFTVRVESADHAPFTAENIPPGTSLSLSLASGSPVGGRVLDFERREPLREATVAVCDRGGLTFGLEACLSAETDDEGRFVVPHAPDGELQARAAAPGYAVSAIERLRLPADGDPPQLTFHLRPGAAIGGRVVDEQGEPLGGARVYVSEQSRSLRDLARRDVEWPVLSDEHGAYLLEGVPSGKAYKVQAHRSDRPTAETGPVHVDAGRDLRNVVVEMPAGARLAVRLVDRDEVPVEAVTLHLRESVERPPGFDLWGVRIDADEIDVAENGRFLARNLGAGAFDLLIQPSGYAEIERSEVVLRPGQTTDLGTLVVAEGRTVSGRITDPTGEPIANATVKASYVTDSGKRSRSAASGQAGRYDLRGLPESAVTLTAAARGHVALTREGIRPDEVTVDFTLGRTAGIAGRVLLEGGDAPAGFMIAAHPQADAAAETPEPARPPQRRTFADDDGRFRMEELEPGLYTVEARAAGWAPGRVPGVRLTAGEMTAVETIVLGPGVTLDGRVVAREDEAPLPGAWVEARRRAAWLGEGDGGGPTATATDERGRFELRGLTSGAYTIEAGHPSFASAEVEVRLVPETEPDELVLRLTRGGGLAGTVRDRAGRPSANRTVFVRGEWLDEEGTRYAITDADGHYELSRLAAGSYEAGLAPEPGGAATIGWKTAVIRENEITRLDFDEAARIRLFGTVRRGDEPVGGATLAFAEARGGPSSSSFQFALADAGGRYEIGLERAGAYRVIVDSGGGAVGSVSTQIEVPDEVEVLRDIVLGLEGIAGSVRDPEGNPLRGAAVSARRDGPAGGLSALLVAETDAAGRYAIQGLSEGSYRVSAVAVGFQSGLAYPVEVGAAGADSQVDFTLERGRMLRGRLIDSRGRGIAGGYVFAAPSGSTDSSMSAANTLTDVNGAFQLTAPAGGALDVAAFAHGWAPVRLIGVTPSDDPETPGLVLQAGPGGSLRVRVTTGAEELPLAGIRLSIRAVPPFPGSDLARLFRPPQPTDAAGLTRLDHLTPGIYEITVPDRRELGPSRVVVNDGAETLASLEIP